MVGDRRPDPRPPVVEQDVGSRGELVSGCRDGLRGREGLRQVPAGRQVLAEAEIRIHAGDAIEVRTSLLLVQEDGADIGIGQDVAAEAQRREVRGGHGTLLALLDVQQADRIDALPAGQPRAAEDRNRLPLVGQADPPAEEQAHVLRLILPAGGDAVAAPP